MYICKYVYARMEMEMRNSKRKPKYGDRMQNGRSDRYMKIVFLGNIWKYPQANARMDHGLK